MREVVWHQHLKRRLLALSATVLGLVLVVGSSLPVRAGLSVIPSEGRRAIELSAAGMAWVKRYGGSAFDTAYDVQQTTDGGYIVVGKTESFGAGWEDMWVLKLDAGGNVQWQKTYGRGADEIGASIQQTTDGGYIVAGWSDSFFGLWVLKLDANGNIQWQKTYEGGLSGYPDLTIQQTSDGGYIVAGGTYYFGSGKFDLWVLKLDANGHIQWQKTFGGKDDEWATDIQQTPDGGYIVTGWTRSFGAGRKDMWVLKLDANGDIQWQKTFGGRGDDAGEAVQQTPDGGYIVAGGFSFLGVSWRDMWVLKLDANGNVQWQKIYGGRADDWGTDIQQTADGGYVATGWTYSFGGVWVLKLDANGNMQWQRAYGGNGIHTGNAIRQTADGGYIVAGSTRSFGAEDYDMWVLKLDANGDIPGCGLVRAPNVTVRGTTVTGATTKASVASTSATMEDSAATVITTNVFPREQCFVGTPPPTPTPTTGMVQGYVWADTDRDAERDSDEKGLPGLTVRLAPAQVQGRLGQTRQTVTDAQGFFHFTDVSPGRYTVSLVYPGGVYPVRALSQEIEVVAGRRTEVPFPIYPLPYSQYMPAAVR